MVSNVKYQFTMVQFLKIHLYDLITWSRWYFCEKNVPKSLFENIIFYLIKISLISAHHLWILTLLWGIGSNWLYQPIILAYIISYIDLGSENDHNPNDRLQSLWQHSFLEKKIISKFPMQTSNVTLCTFQWQMIS